MPEPPGAAAPSTPLGPGGGPGAELPALLRPEDHLLLQRLRRVLEALGDPARVTVHTAIHALLDLALAYRRDRGDRLTGEGGAGDHY